MLAAGGRLGERIGVCLLHQVSQMCGHLIRVGKSRRIRTLEHCNQLLSQSILTIAGSSEKFKAAPRGRKELEFPMRWRGYLGVATYWEALSPRLRSRQES
jgi:hypothetical protein